jgi:hypothetical protein
MPTVALGGGLRPRSPHKLWVCGFDELLGSEVAGKLPKTIRNVQVGLPAGL